MRIVKPSRLAAAVLAVALSGCASLAVKPPTPADDQRFFELEREPAPPNEQYYLLMFGSQSEPKLARYTHTWATVVRVVDLGPNQAPAIEPFTISWMPATLDIRPWRRRVEQGVNLDLCNSINEALKHDERISLWGPYRLRTGLYRKFLIQRQFVESGRLGYQCVDTVGEAARVGNGSNCIHAITDMDSLFSRGGYPLWRFGEQASEYIVEQVVARGGFIDPCTTHDWLLAPLGIAGCPICKRSYDPAKVERLRAKIERRSRWDGRSQSGLPPN